jgi:hypothetical protein
MNAQHEAIFRQAMSSKNRDAVLRVAQLFHAMGDFAKAKQLYQRTYQFGFAFGAMARGTPIAGTNGAVIPPGRYWIDLTTDEKRKAWVNFTVDKPEVIVEKTDWDAGTPQNVVETVIFTIPPTANNYGKPGVLFPTKVLGFPTIAAATVKSKEDTVQRPAPMTYTEAAKEVVTTSGKAVGTAVGTGVKSLGEGVSAGLGVSPTVLWLGLGTAALLALKLLL